MNNGDTPLGGWENAGCNKKGEKGEKQYEMMEINYVNKAFLGSEAGRLAASRVVQL
jgi:hypothetical protein